MKLNLKATIGPNSINYQESDSGLGGVWRADVLIESLPDSSEKHSFLYPSVMIQASTSNGYPNKQDLEWHCSNLLDCYIDHELPKRKLEKERNRLFSIEYDRLMKTAGSIKVEKHIL